MATQAIDRLASRNIAAIRDSKCSETPSSRSEPSELRPTPTHKRIISSLSIRYPCPRDTDPDEYRARIDMLAYDTASLETSVLRKACDLLAQRSRFLPLAAEIFDAAKGVIEDRQRAAKQQEAEAEGRDPDAGFDVAAWARQQNLTAESKGMRTRLIVVGGRTQMVDYLIPEYEIGADGLKRMAGWRRNPEVRQLADGTVQQAFLSAERQEMIFADGMSVDAVAARDAADWAAE